MSTSTKSLEINLSLERFKDKHCDLRHNTANPSIYVAKPTTTFEDTYNELKKLEVGSGEAGENCIEKTVLVVGGTGAGKSTLLNGFFNYITGVRLEDNFRFKLLEEVPGGEPQQAKSVTTGITAYTIHHQPFFKVPYTLTVIDTPGYGDTRGIDADRMIVDRLRKLLGSTAGVKQVHAVGFVVQSSLPRLTATQKYIYESVMSLFGKDIQGSIYMLITFADGGEPNVKAALQEVKAPYEDYFKFNNSALYVRQDKEDDFNRLFYEMGTKSCRIFLKTLEKLEPKSLIQTQKVILERDTLKQIVDNLHDNLKITLVELNQRKAESIFLKKHGHEANKMFKSTKIEVKEHPSAQWNMNCTNCKTNCCKSCRASFINWKWLCSEMAIDSTCKICGCGSSNHTYEKFIYVHEVKEVEMSVEEIKERYMREKGKPMTVENVLLECQEKIGEKEAESRRLIYKAHQCTERLDNIALRPTCQSVEQYIDVLIEAEKDSAIRVAQLKELKEKEGLLMSMSEGYSSDELAMSMMGSLHVT